MLNIFHLLSPRSSREIKEFNYFEIIDANIEINQNPKKRMDNDIVFDLISHIFAKKGSRLILCNFVETEAVNVSFELYILGCLCCFIVVLPSLTAIIIII